MLTLCWHCQDRCSFNQSPKHKDFSRFMASRRSYLCQGFCTNAGKFRQILNDSKLSEEKKGQVPHFTPNKIMCWCIHLFTPVFSSFQPTFIRKPSSRSRSPSVSHRSSGTSEGKDPRLIPGPKASPSRPCLGWKWMKLAAHRMLVYQWATKNGAKRGWSSQLWKRLLQCFAFINLKTRKYRPGDAQPVGSGQFSHILPFSRESTTTSQHTTSCNTGDPNKK